MMFEVFCKFDINVKHPNQYIVKVCIRGLHNVSRNDSSKKCRLFCTEINTCSVLCKRWLREVTLFSTIFIQK